jgi:hypothetical protein
MKYLTWTDLIDVRFLRQYVRTIDYPRFLEINGPEISTVVHVSMCFWFDETSRLTHKSECCTAWNRVEMKPTSSTQLSTLISVLLFSLPSCSFSKGD